MLVGIAGFYYNNEYLAKEKIHKFCQIKVYKRCVNFP